MAALTLGGGCGTTRPAPAVSSSAPPSAEGAEDSVSALAAAYWEQRLEADPIGATILGDRRFDDQMPDVSPAALQRELAQLEALRRRVQQTTAAAAADQVTRVLLLGEIDADLARGACFLSEWSIDPRGGPQVGYLRLAELQPVTTVAQGRALVSRWQKMGATLDQHTANLRAAAAAGKVATRDEITRVLGQLDAMLRAKDEAWTLRTPALGPHLDWPEEDRRAFAAGVDQAIATSIRPAFTRYRDVIREEILPRARDEAHAGLSHVPGGADCYRRLVKVHTSLELRAEDIHQLGLDELARIHAELRRTGAKALGTDDFARIRARLRGDRTLYFGGRDEIEAMAREALDRATAAMPRFLGRSPQTPCVVKRIEPFEEKDSTIAYYQQPAMRGASPRPGTYYVNTYEPRTRPRFEAEALAFHEAIPGHHVQIALAQEQDALPEFRKHMGVTAFVEGWGLYAERLADELALYSDDHQRLGMLSFDAWRASRLVVDTGIHALGWSRRRAIAFLEENTALARANIVNEVDRYIGWPAQALAYKIGQRELFKLRAEAQEKLGPRFDLRRFHDVVLGNGAVSLAVLREQVARWIEGAAAAR